MQEEAHMNINQYHLRLQGGHWVLEKEDSAAPIRTFWTKKEGVNYSLSYIEHFGGSLTIHRLDGSQQESRSYPGGLPPISIAA
jgi:hypothetical protein